MKRINYGREGELNYDIRQTRPLPDWMRDRTLLPKKPPVRPKKLSSFPPPPESGNGGVG